MAPAGMIDLRSDTVTKPTDAMRGAMASAEVGDDVFGEDPTVRRLEETVAALLGKEAALLVPSGTMSNQLAILSQTRRGDEILVSEGAHCAWYESGAASALAGVQAVVLGTGGMFEPASIVAALKPEADWYPRTSLVAVENTHNRAGGRVWPFDQLRAVVAQAKALHLRLHLDGARIWNASIACGVDVSTIADGFDTVSVCFSKGLGAPIGSALCGTKELMREARKLRKMLGGGMRQAGVIAAAALHGLAHHRARLPLDHANAQAIAHRLAQVQGARVDAASVETNIVMIDTPGLAAIRVAEAARTRGVLVSVFGPERVRVVTHLDVETTAQEGGIRLAEAIASLVQNA